MKIVAAALILAAVVICCTAMPKKRFCSRKPKTGPCRGSFERYFYNTTSERCEIFTYGGCKGNKNRFTSFLRCMQTCHECEVEGAEYSSCDSICRNTCESPNNTLFCRAPCRYGCACSRNLVLDTKNQRCIPVKKCPPKCPIEGQIYYGDRCAPCDGTCDRPLIPCPRICRRGCACPIGQVIDPAQNRCVALSECPRQVIDPARNRCVALSDCPPRCPIQGQRYFNASKGECVPCTGTCEDTNPVCTRECRSGCGCPTGTVLDEKNKRCIHPRTCSRECEYEGVVYQPREGWDCSDSGKCMKCWCLLNGVVANYTIDCPKGMCVLKNGTHVPNGTSYQHSPCEYCTCNNGSITCVRRDCARPLCGNSYVPNGKCCPVCPEPCRLLNGTVIPHGRGYSPHPCAYCSCTDGKMSCFTRHCVAPSCSNYYVPPGECCPVCPPKGCRYNGQVYKPGETFNSTDGCNTCTCYLGGLVGCTRKACRPKMICPTPFPLGTKGGVCAELCSSDNDCALDEKCCSNRCGHQCTKGTLCAAVLCPSLPGCPLRNVIPPGPDECCGTCGCRYGGKLYRPGDKFPAIDGCNTCACSGNGSVSCTEKYCPPTAVCPKPTGFGICVELCSRDENCRLGQKCCSNGCGHVCTTIQNCALVDCAVPVCNYLTGAPAPAPPGTCCPVCGCKIGGSKVVRIGESFPAGDGCNVCSCTTRGPLCTRLACSVP